jgi:hypothetical protein
VATPEEITDYDDGPAGPLWGYDWRAHLAADVVALAVALGSAAGLAWLALAGGPTPF